jgi:hypothetical protein
LALDGAITTSAVGVGDALAVGVGLPAIVAVAVELGVVCGVRVAVGVTCGVAVVVGVAVGLGVGVLVGVAPGFGSSLATKPFEVPAAALLLVWNAPEVIGKLTQVPVPEPVQQGNGVPTSTHTDDSAGPTKP